MYKNQTIPKKRSHHSNSVYWQVSQAFVFISLCFYPLSSKLAEVSGERFVKLDHRGAPIRVAGNNMSGTDWDCVLDNKTGLVWEVKTLSGLRSRKSIYTWYNPDPKRDGGTPGYRDGGQCSDSACDTNAYVDAVNKTVLCGYHNWRLPTREELRSLVDYKIKPPQPMIDRQYFPHSEEQFYWSSTADASDADSAWGIGFAFGYDYSYFKYGFGYIRLVTTYRS
jgi:hypothetical protein